MKKLTLTLCAVAAVVSASFAGTASYDGKEMKQTETPCPSWYADNEWNIGISGLYAGNVGDDDNAFFDNNWSDGFGGAVDVKYFFHRYWGIGVQAFGISVDRDNDFFFNSDDDDFVGGALATFTFRYSTPCSRFAPYLWIGVGGFFEGDNNDNFARFNNDNDSEFMGQFGIGGEYRFTQHFGLTTDISFNDVEGGDNDFIMVRAGLNFAF